MNPLCESQPVLPSPKIDLIASIENFIDLRDKHWLVLANQSETPSKRDIGLLRSINDSLKQMLELKPGPATPVLSPARSKVELLRTSVCAVFISTVEREQCAAQIHNPSATVEEAFKPHALRILGATSFPVG